MVFPKATWERVVELAEERGIEPVEIVAQALAAGMTLCEHEGFDPPELGEPDVRGPR